MTKANQDRLTRRYKIAHVATVGSTLLYFLNLLRRLVVHGYAVSGISNPGPQSQVLEANGIQHRAVALTRRFSPLVDARSLWSLYKLFRSDAYDIVHTHTPKGNLLGQWAAFFARTPVRVATIHGLYFTPASSPLRKIAFSLIETISLLPSHLVFLVNRQDYETLAQLRLCNMDKVHLLPGGIGIDLHRFDRTHISQEHIALTRRHYGLEPEHIVVGFVGRLVYEKGILELLNAFVSLSAVHRNLRLLLVGPIDVDKSDAVSPSVIEEMGIQDLCILTGAIEDTPQMYALIDIFVLPSHREGMPLVTMEAQAMSLPVVTTTARGCRESIIDGQTGIFVPVGDEQSLASALEKLIDDADLRKWMGQNGRRLAEERYDETVVIAETEAHYQRLLAARQ